MLIPYLRQSKKAEGEPSTADQLKEIERWASERGVALAEPVAEPGVSGVKPWRERRLGEVVERCERGEAEGVIVAYQSRLTRDAQWHQVSNALRPYRFVSVRDGIDKKPGERLQVAGQIMAVLANEEWEVLSSNLRAGKHASWEKGMWRGYAPAGYDAQVDPAVLKKNGAPGKSLVKNGDAPAVAAALRLRADGASWTEVARLLTARGVPARKGWTWASAAKVIRNPVYKGSHRCDCGCGAVASRSAWAVVAPSLWDKAQWKPERKEGALAVGRVDKGSALLAGLLRCEGCGNVMRSSSTGKYRFYRCGERPACPASAAVSATKVEGHVREQVFDYLSRRDWTRGREPDVSRIAELEAAVEVARRDLSELEAEQGKLTPLAWGRVLTRAEMGLLGAENALLEERGSERVSVTPQEFLEAWKRQDRDELRAVLRTVLDCVWVRKGKGPLYAEGKVKGLPANVGRASIEWSPTSP
jgi:DNA invertase Pin-like site-specific DNA recombinase